MKQLKELHRWHQTRTGLVFFGLLELLIAYFFASRAIDTANLWQYALCFVFVLGGLNNFYKALGFGGVKSGSKPKN
jgi:hypothetical protein